MIKTNNNHKRVNTSLIKKFNYFVTPIIVAGIIVGYCNYFTNNHSDLKNNKDIKNNEDTITTFFNTEYYFDNIDNLDFLIDYMNCTSLYISDSTINDLSILSNLENLTKISFIDCNLGVNTIESKSIEEIVLLNDNCLLDINCPNLEKVKCDANNNYIELNSINSNKLTSINITNTIVNDYSFMYSDDLNYLYLAKMNLKRLDTKLLSSNLTELSFDNVMINDIDIRNDNNILKFSFVNCDLYDFNFINKLNYLEEASLWYTNFNDISLFKDMKYLRSLNITGTKVSSIYDLPNSIENLYMAHMDSINDISYISKLDKLKSIDLTGIEYLVNGETYNFLKNNGVYNSVTKEEMEVLELYQEVCDSIITSDMNDFDKVNAIIKYCVNRIDYDSNLIGDSNILTNAINGRGVCQAYADMACVLGKIAGLDIKNIYSPGHVWNICKIYDYYYYFDATWVNKVEINNDNYVLHGLTPIYDIKYHVNYYSKPFISDVFIDNEVNKWINNGVIDNYYEGFITSRDFSNIINNLFNTNLMLDGDFVTNNNANGIFMDYLNIEPFPDNDNYVSYNFLINILNNSIGNFYNKPGNYYINSGNCFVNSSDVILEGYCNILYVDSYCNVNIDKLKYDEIRYLNKNKSL